MFRKRRQSEKLDWNTVFGDEAIEKEERQDLLTAHRVPAQWALRTADSEDDLDIDIRSALNITTSDLSARPVSVLIPEVSSVVNDKNETREESASFMSAIDEFARSIRAPHERDDADSGEDVPERFPSTSSTSQKRRGFVEVVANEQLSVASQIPNVIETVLEEKSLQNGLADTLHVLQSAGVLREDAERQRERAEDIVSIEHVDEYGRILDAKDAYRQMSYKFHGKGPGKNKRERLLRKMVVEKASKLRGTSHPPTLKALKKSGSDHLSLQH